MDSSPDYKFIFFNVGQGDATLLCYQITKKSILVDAYKSEPILEELKNADLNLNAIFISHWDTDHIKGLVDILEYQKRLKSKVILGVNRQIKDTKVAKIFSQKIDEAIEEGTIERNDTIPLLNQHVSLPDIEGFDIVILWPPNFQMLRDSDVNNDSVILKIKINGKNLLLLPGDASGDCWDKIETGKLKADIFKYPHHGGSIAKSITAKELIEKVNPKKVVVSYGKNNSYGHPGSDFKNAKSELSNNIEFYDTTSNHIVIYYDSNKNILS